ncbi:hypothetical protein BH20ACT5_BH20ACT5_10970 [soil metagenome]
MISSGTIWVAIALCAVVTFLAKGIGPAVTGDRELPAPLVRVVVLLAAPLLAAPGVTQALADGTRWQLGADTVGVAFAGLLLWLRAPIVVVVLAAAAVTALLRLAGLD